MTRIIFNKPFMTGKELFHIAEAHFNSILAGDGPFTRRCHAWLEAVTGARKALLTHSCTAALEMAAILADIGSGDEVIMPSYTFVSTANAFALRGGVPVFVDVRPDTFNLDERRIEAAITPRTKAVVPVHYAGVACDMDRIMAIAERHGLLVIEDAAQGILASYKGRPLGSIGHLGTLSFHETKNITSGEGGALLVNDARLVDRAEIIREKGTNRSQFFRGEIDKYTWCDIGSSFLPGEITAAFLWAQMQEAETITARRLAIWSTYRERLLPLQEAGRLRLPRVPDGCQHNAHMHYVVLPTQGLRDGAIQYLKAHEIDALFHYVPLHDSPGGRTRGRVVGALDETRVAADRLMRLPLWLGIEPHVDQVCEVLRSYLESHRS
ncbi:MAG: dTDP-4-amino-4,6-dideoxygalactose transaminase [Burkholderiales bacterium]